MLFFSDWGPLDSFHLVKQIELRFNFFTVEDLASKRPPEILGLCGRLIKGGVAIRRTDLMGIHFES